MSRYLYLHSASNAGELAGRLGKAGCWLKGTLARLSSAPLISGRFTGNPLTSLLRLGAWPYKQSLHASIFFCLFVLPYFWFIFGVMDKQSLVPPTPLTASGQAHPEGPSGSTSQALGPTLLGATVAEETSAKGKELSDPTRTPCLGKVTLWVTTAPASPFHNIPPKMLVLAACARRGQSRGWRRHRRQLLQWPAPTIHQYKALSWQVGLLHQLLTEPSVQCPMSSWHWVDQDTYSQDEPTLPLAYPSHKQTLAVTYEIVYNPPFGNHMLTVSSLLSWLV